MIDLHTHSVVSDGSDSPEHLVELAAAAGCSALALTDHDRLDGNAGAARTADALGVRFVPGCEISCEVTTGTMHMLVYWLGPGPGPLQDELFRLQAARETRNTRLIERLRELGLPVDPDEVAAEAGGGAIGRPHIAAVLVRKGVVSSIQEAFDVWLGKGRPGYLDKERLAPHDAIRLARASGAVAVLAHPRTLDLAPADLDRTVGELADLGLGGLEAIYGRYSPAERSALAMVASNHGLAITGGSDHHGTYKPDLSVGVGQGDLDVPDHLLEALAARRPLAA